MKTQSEIEEIKEGISNKISIVADKARSCRFDSDEYEIYDHEYAKLTAQYNILLEVLR